MVGVINHYNKVVFAVNSIEYDGEFRSIMDEVCNEMVIEMNYANPDDHVPEVERNNIVIE